MLHGKDLGKAGEELAERFLQRRGYIIVERCLRVRGGELDLIARDGEEWVFVEVKTRADNSMGSASEAMTRGKIARFGRAVRQYVYTHGLEEQAIRLDVIAIDFAGDEPTIQHFPSAVTSLE